jgi:hypothetical protein
MNEEFQCVLLKGIRFRKGERFAHKTSKALAQSVVEALNMSSFFGCFAHRAMVCAQMTKDLVVGFPEIVEGGAVAILGWNPGPESPTTLFTAVTDEEGDNLSGASTKTQPNPALVLLGADEAS